MWEDEGWGRYKKQKRSRIRLHKKIFVFLLLLLLKKRYGMIGYYCCFICLTVSEVFTAGCNLDRDCLNPRCGLPFESDRPLRSCVNTENKQMSFRIGFGGGINEIEWATYAFSWLSKWWTNSSRLLTMATSSSSSSFSRSFCASVFCQSAEGWKTKDTWNEASQHSCDLINRKRSVQHTRSPYPIQFE